MSYRTFLFRTALRPVPVSNVFRVSPFPPASKLRPKAKLSSKLRASTSSSRHSQSPSLRADVSSVLILATVCVTLGGSIILYRIAESPSKSAEPWPLLSEEEADWMMVQNIQPGRPGNLTVEQEIKLQEFWKVTLKVFGVPLPDAEDVIAPEETGDPKGTDTGLTEDKKKKKSKSLFGRKKKDGIKDDVEAPKIVADSEDKYGQTKEFHQALASNTPEELRQTFWSMVKCDNPDALLLRFLRARKWDIEKALVMMVSTMQWRAKEMHVDDDIVRTGEAAALDDSASPDAAVKKEGADFMEQLRLGKSYLHGTDREGRPMCTVRTRLHKQGEQSEKSLERSTVHVLETARLLLVAPVDTASIIFDMTGFSMANMDYTPVKFMIKCFEANYPESLGVILVHKAPWIFQGIWKIIKGWLDPVVAGKVHFTNTVDELSKYVARERIPAELGGDDPYTYAYVEPTPGENAELADAATRDRLLEARAAIVREFEAATQAWVAGPPDAAEVRERRREIAERLRKGYWELDPYVRARSLCDRIGVIGKGGRIEFYPEKAEAKSDGEVAKADGPAPAGHDPDGVD